MTSEDFRRRERLAMIKSLHPDHGGNPDAFIEALRSFESRAAAPIIVLRPSRGHRILRVVSRRLHRRRHIILN